jgi:alkylation response protein AidB-like acyl-CoA dehydrogenase
VQNSGSGTNTLTGGGDGLSRVQMLGIARQVARLVRDGVARTPDLDLPQEAERYRAEARAFVASLDGLDATARRARMVESGYLVPHWPPPWGRDASAAEQLVIEQELRGANVPNMGITGWNIQTISQHGTPEQAERWVGPTLRGEITWCQLFSEPGAGSDLASLQLRATPLNDGWVLNGQKVWTSMAKEADWGICLARTDPDKPKHDGISCFMIDMKSPGLDIRPLRELTGQEMFNEVFFDDVFVPDDHVVGELNKGFQYISEALDLERFTMFTFSPIEKRLAAKKGEC